MDQTQQMRKNPTNYEPSLEQLLPDGNRAIVDEEILKMEMMNDGRSKPSKPKTSASVHPHNPQNKKDSNEIKKNF